MITRLRRFVRWQYIQIVGTRLPPCEDITRILSAELDRPLSVRERWQKRLHLLFCTLCTRYGQQIALMRKLAAEARAAEDGNRTAALPGLSPERRARIRQRVAGAGPNGPAAGN